ncbi:MAG TPA: hypothetical protein VJ481_02580 [Patescibacteria group bacterium]|uniref:Uncharacterized protein n=1 Tax=Candidatus Woesebacteria bacterium RBG_13_46_13 TaxID=1802479 RepID=A0A1F7X4H8_9BACT|nr:MAG: hypothetical protein A2Y68_00620 [Candidatus Woesebacteria bacterium RBG_13_46_13]HJX59418.1 hypothetical protein [Patescibacteria group bacterium]
MKTGIKLLLVVGATALFLIFNHFWKCEGLRCLSFTGLENYKTIEVYKNDASSYKAMLSIDSGELLRVETRYGWEPSQAQKYISSETQRIKGLFADAPAPYPGDVSNEIVCAKEYAPKYFEKNIGDTKLYYFLGNMNSRLTLGGCSPAQAVYKVQLGWIYCSQQKNLYQLEFIVPASSYDKNPERYEGVLVSIRCVNPLNYLKTGRILP